MKYAVNEEGVSAMHTMSQKVQEAIEAIEQLNQSVKSTADGHANVLGPHKSSLDDAIDSVNESVKTGTEPAAEVAEALDDVADGYEAVISNDRIRGKGN